MNNMIDKIKKNNLTPLIIVVVGVLLFSLLLIITHRLQGSDDTSFIKQIEPYKSVGKWVNFRYNNWSGRVFAESFVYIFSSANLMFWKLVTLLMYVLSSFYLFLMYKLWDDKPTKEKNTYIIAIVSMLPFLMGYEVLFAGTFWITGGMCYFWMTTFGLMSLYPVFFYLKFNKKPAWYFTVAGIFGTIIAASSQEQIGITILLLSVFVLACIFYKHYKLTKKIKIPLYILLFVGLALVSLAISIVAPGNRMRFQAETINWLPDFMTIPLTKHIEYGYRWFLEGFINNTGVILPLIWGCMGLLFLKIKTFKNVGYILSIVFITAAIFTLSKGHEATHFWFNFYATWNVHITNKLAYISVIPWTFMLLISIVAPILLYKKSIKGWILSVLFTASIATTLMMVVSPTMYASGWRTLFVPSYLLLIILLFLFSDIINIYKKYSTQIILVVAIFALSQYINTLYHLHTIYK